MDDATVGRVDVYARQYAQFLGRAKTARAAVTELERLFTAAGGQLLTQPEAGLAGTSRTTHRAKKPPGVVFKPGTRYYLRGGDGHTAAFVALGRQSLERGARIIIAPLDAPHIQLKQRPVYDRAGLIMFDTVIHGVADLRLWLSRPLALHLHVARPGAADGGLDLIVGERPDDPVLVIPDLLPHLSGRVQKNQVVDSAERMDAVAARSYRALVDYLAGQGLDVNALATAESALLPAGPPVFVGADRALLAGYGHSHRALAYAAVRALIDTGAELTPEQTAVVIVTRSADPAGGTSGLGFVRTAMTQLLGALSVTDGEPDVLATRRMYARSTAWIASAADDLATDKGIGIAPRGADAVPRATRRTIDSLEASGAPYQLVGRQRWGPGRSLAPLDMDVVGVAIPTRHRRAPAELVSTLDLYYAQQAARAWLLGS